jgi:hypothetical protein
MKCLFNARNKSRDRWFLMYHKRYKEYGEEMFTIKRFINQTPYLGIIRLMRITIRKKLSVVVETISNQGISLIAGTTMSHSYEQIGRSRLMSNILISLMSRIFKFSWNSNTINVGYIQMKLSPFYYPCIVIAQHVPRTMSTYLISDSGEWTLNVE